MGSFREARSELRKAHARSSQKLALLSGPRRVGKTTLLLELAAELGDRAIYVSGDDPTMLLPHAWTRLWEDAEHRARRDGSVTVMLDEVHQWPDWQRRLESVWSHVTRERLALRVIASTSCLERSAPRGRAALEFENIRISHWSASAVAQTFDVSPVDAAEALVAFGGYPGAYQFMRDGPRWSAFVRESILEPALGRDLGSRASVRQPTLLRQVFAAAALHPCETISLQRMQAVLLQAGALTTIGGYLRLLEDAELVAPLPRHSTRRVRRRSAPPKLVVLNNALLSALHPSGPPDREREPARHDVWIENACLAHAVNSGQHVSYWREEPFDVDAVLEGAWGQWAIEVMPNVHSSVDYRGLHEFVERYSDYKPLVVTSDAHLTVATRAGLAATTWQRFLLDGPPR
ncbi:MAG: ATP-binding protein [Vicinamibacterales bacterium]